MTKPKLNIHQERILAMVRQDYDAAIEAFDAQNRRMRSYAVIVATSGASTRVIAAALKVSPMTISRWVSEAS